MDINKSYETSVQVTENGKFLIFISHGKERRLKAIEFSSIGKIGQRPVFNLGFGDYDIITGNISDDIITNNGDVYVIFNTVLISVKDFLGENPDAIVMVRGSDSSADFITKCKLSCKRGCISDCKNKNRRINIYRSYLDKNYTELNISYSLFGSFKSSDVDFVIEDFNIGAKYLSLFITKR